MVTKDLQTLNLRFDQVKFNSLVLKLERNFEMTFGIFSVLVFQISVLESYLDIYCFKISYDKIYENGDNLGLLIKVLPIFRLYQKSTPQICLILHQFNRYILLICGKEIGDD